MVKPLNFNIMKKIVLLFLAALAAVGAVVATAMRNDVFEQNVNALADLNPGGIFACVNDKSDVLQAGPEYTYLCDGCEPVRGRIQPGAISSFCEYTPDEDF